MRLVLFDDYQVGILDGQDVCDVSDAIPERWRRTPHAMTALIESFDECRQDIEALAAEGPTRALDQVRLLPPQPRPLNLLAAPMNYSAHQAEMANRPGVSAPQTPREIGFFVKAQGAISGPHDPIELPPLAGRQFDHEVELGVVIGREARAVPAADAWDHVFGFTTILDLTMRMTETQREERVMRKSFATFAPMGPAILTRDEVSDVGALEVTLSVDGAVRQHAPVSDLIVDIPGLIELMSNVLPLSPGDVIATGTPSGVGPLEPGHRVVASVTGLPPLELDVVARTW